MRPTQKTPQARPRTQLRASSCIEQVLEVCHQLPALNVTPGDLSQHIADSARRIFAAAVAGVMVQSGEGEKDLPGVGFVATDERGAKKALLEHARSFAAQAIEQKKMLNFRFSYRSPAGEAIYHGLAQPLADTRTSSVLLVVRSSVFSPAEVSAFKLLGNMARLALDNAELTGLCATQKQHLDQLLEISAELGATAQLESFLTRFVVRAAEFM